MYKLRWLWGVKKTFFFSSQTCRIFESDLPCFGSGFPFLQLDFPIFRFSPSHFSNQSFLLFPVSPSHFSSKTLTFFWASTSRFSKSVLLIFQVRPYRFLGSVLPIFSSQTFSLYLANFYYFEFIVQFVGLIKRCLTWYVNRKYTFQWINWFRWYNNKLFLCRVHVHWNFIIFKCVPWTPN